MAWQGGRLIWQSRYQVRRQAKRVHEKRKSQGEKRTTAYLVRSLRRSVDSANWPLNEEGIGLGLPTTFRFLVLG